MKLRRVAITLALLGLVVSAAGAQKTSDLREEVAALVRRVAAGDYVARHRLIKIGQPAVQPLFELVASETGRAALEARCALRWIAHRAAQSPSQRRALTATLVKLTQAGQPLTVRQFAAELLGLCGGDEAVSTLAALLREEEMQGAACEALQQIPGPPATQALAEALKTASPGFRRSLLWALGERGDPAAIPALAAAAQDPNEKVKLAALTALGRVDGAAVVPLLHEALATDSEAVKTATLQALLQVAERYLTRKEPKHALALYRNVFILASGEAERLAALNGLGRTGEAAAVPLLLRALEEGSERIKTAALNAYLGLADAHLRKGQKREALNIYRCVLSLATRDAARVAALAGLGRTKSAEAIPHILSLIAKASPEVQVTAVTALHQIPGKEATRALANALKDAPSSARIALLRALSERGDTEAVPAIAAVVRDENEEVRLAALQALANLPDARAVPALLGALETGPDRVRAAAVEAYLRVGEMHWEKGQTAEALAVYHRALEAATSDSQRVAALRGLGQIGSVESLPKVEPLLERAKGEVRDEALNAYIAIGDQLAAANRREEALRVYQRALKLVPADKRALHVAGKLRALGVKMEFASHKGVVSYWWLIGPFPAPNEAAWRKEFFPEREIDLAREYEFEGKKLRWQPYHTTEEHGIVRLDPLFEPNEHVICYAYVELTLEREQDVLLRLGSDDGVVCWLNGKQIHAKLVPRSLRVDEDSIQAHLKAGANRLLLKVIEIGGDWAYCLRLTDLNGQPVEFKMR